MSKPIKNEFVFFSVCCCLALLIAFTWCLTSSIDGIINWNMGEPLVEEIDITVVKTENGGKIFATDDGTGEEYELFASTTSVSKLVEGDKLHVTRIRRYHKFNGTYTERFTGQYDKIIELTKER